MSGLGIGDLAQNLALRRQNGALKAEVQRLSLESTTGRAADLSVHLRGDHRASVALSASQNRLAAYKSATAAATTLTDTMQMSLEVVQEQLVSVGSAAMSAASGGAGGTSMSIASAEARNALSAVVSALNAQVAGRSVFSGAAPGAPLPSAQEILDEIAAVIASETSAEGVIAAVGDWFDDPAGFAALYRGGDPLAPLPIADGETVALSVTALDPALTGALRSLVLASLPDQGVLAGDGAGQARLLEAGGSGALTVNADVAELAARIGLAQGRIAQAETRNAAEASAVAIALSALVEVDPYESATRLEAAEGQLQTLYAVTARISALSLTDYLA